MGEAKRKRLSSFSEDLIRSWEEEDCVNFAIALSRITNWLLHVDWATTAKDLPVDEMTPLRVYVGDHKDNIFDVRGITKIGIFNKKTIEPLILSRCTNKRAISTKFYTEEKLWELPLRVKPNEIKILDAMKKISENSLFTSIIPQRQRPIIPAYIAAQCSYGWCAVYAEALSNITGLKATSIIAQRFISGAQIEDSDGSGYAHSFVLHEDGTAEDAWGKQSIEEIASRFFILEYHISSEKHLKVVNTLRNNSPDKFNEIYKETSELIKKYR